MGVSATRCLRPLLADVAHHCHAPGLAPCVCGLCLLSQDVRSARVPQTCPRALLARSAPSSLLVPELTVAPPALSGSWVGRLGDGRWRKGR